MTRHGYLRGLIAVALVAGVLPACAAKAPQQHRTGPDSFLPWRAYSVSFLVDQVQSDPVVRARLARHFHVAEAELANYFRDNLREVTISESGWRPVYGVTRTGMIYRSRDYFHKGAKAFGLADGTPILKFACGNPLVTQLPPVAHKKIVGAPPTVRPVIVRVQPQVEITPELTLVSQSPEEMALLPDLPLAQMLAVPPAVAAKHRHFIPLFWWPSSDGDHDHAVPEPATLILLGGGLVALGAKVRLRRRR
jgi:hypothetical protein